MDVETFFEETKGRVVNLMSREIQDLNWVKEQTTTWIRFKIEVEDRDGKVIRVNMVDKALFNSQMTEVFNLVSGYCY